MQNVTASITGMAQTIRQSHKLREDINCYTDFSRQPVIAEAAKNAPNAQSTPNTASSTLCCRVKSVESITIGTVRPHSKRWRGFQTHQTIAISIVLYV